MLAIQAANESNTAHNLQEGPLIHGNGNAMRHKLKILTTAAYLLFLTQTVAASPMLIQWSDKSGDFSSVGDVASARLSFDSSGAWTAAWYADAAHPFTGSARFNLNLFDTALGNLQSAIAPQVSLDNFHNFGSGTATFYSYSGNSAYLSNWHVGDTVSTGNTTNFLSGVVNLNTPFGRDNLVTTGVVSNAVSEPETYPLIFLALIGAVLARRKHLRNTGSIEPNQ